MFWVKPNSIRIIRLPIKKLCLTLCSSFDQKSFCLFISYIWEIIELNLEGYGLLYTKKILLWISKWGLCYIFYYNSSRKNCLVHTQMFAEYIKYIQSTGDRNKILLILEKHHCLFFKFKMHNQVNSCRHYRIWNLCLHLMWQSWKLFIHSSA